MKDLIGQATATMTTAPEHHAGTSDFLINWTPPAITTKNLHWAFDRAMYEIQVNLCENVELHIIVTHCLRN
jgi:hypothetical protein